ncbi:MAG: DUF2089 family protein [Proteobacteria bacterium]|nr:DUF2089 family protein [Pseudomonadota bacterium]MDA1299036.1 DUF2089 family protein [Pseudomonadota bacterium]
MTDYLDTSHPCPACGKAMQPSALSCACGVRIEAPLALNEFASLSADHLHFLRIFIMFEGRITDIESALGISYPTVKTRIAALKDALELSGQDKEIDAVITQLEAGEINPDEAIRRLT